MYSLPTIHTIGRRLILRAFAAGFLAALAGPPAVAGPETFAVGTAFAGPGQRATGVLSVPAGSDAGLDIPVAVVRGTRSGPVLALVAGAHGTEYASIVAVEKLIETLDPAEMSGTVILVPLLNTASFEQKVPHVNPIDGKNMNRFYPGKADGTQTERALFAVTKQIVERCDYLVDFHGGDLDEDLRPYSYWLKTGNEKRDAVTRQMALAFGLDTIVIAADRPTDPGASRYLDATAATRGKFALTVEAGRAGTVAPEDVSALVNGTLSVMRLLKMLPGAPSPVEHPVWIESIETITSEQTGIFRPLVARGAYVAEGMKIGYVTDYGGRTVFEARAQKAGVVLYVCAVHSMKKGDTIATVGVVAASPP
jgi:predicted deacylase